MADVLSQSEIDALVVCLIYRGSLEPDELQKEGRKT